MHKNAFCFLHLRGFFHLFSFWLSKSRVFLAFFLWFFFKYLYNYQRKLFFSSYMIFLHFYYFVQFVCFYLSSARGRFWFLSFKKKHLYLLNGIPVTLSAEEKRNKIKLPKATIKMVRVSCPSKFFYFL